MSSCSGEAAQRLLNPWLNIIPVETTQPAAKGGNGN